MILPSLSMRLYSGTNLVFLNWRSFEFSTFSGRMWYHGSLALAAQFSAASLLLSSETWSITVLELSAKSLLYLATNCGAPLRQGPHHEAEK